MGKRVKNDYRSLKNVCNNIQAKNGVQNSKNSGLIRKLYIDFNKYSDWTHSYVGHKFTNALKDESQAAENFYFLANELFGSVENNFENIISGKDAHSHKITGKQREKAIKIVNKIHDIELDNEVDIWQLSSDHNKGIRIVGVITTENIYNFYPLFIDHNHLLYPDVKHNQTDYRSYKFCPQEKWN